VVQDGYFEPSNGYYTRDSFLIMHKLIAITSFDGIDDDKNCIILSPDFQVYHQVSFSLPAHANTPLFLPLLLSYIPIAGVARTSPVGAGASGAIAR
jgi:hypothetical protein